MAGDDDRDANPGDLDRAAILARRRRFIALAISGLATAGCKSPSPEPCLSIAPDPAEPTPPEPATAEPTGRTDPAVPGPFVEDPGAPLENDETSGDETGDETGLGEPNRPEVCLKMPAPRPCLNVAPKSKPHPCLMMID